MDVQTITTGQSFEFMPEWCDGDDEFRYIVLEDNGDRCLVQALDSGLVFPPQTTIKKEWINPASIK